MAKDILEKVTEAEAQCNEIINNAKAQAKATADNAAATKAHIDLFFIAFYLLGFAVVSV